MTEVIIINPQQLMQLAAAKAAYAILAAMIAPLIELYPDE